MFLFLHFFFWPLHDEDEYQPGVSEGGDRWPFPAPSTCPGRTFTIANRILLPNLKMKTYVNVLRHVSFSVFSRF